MKFNLRVLPVLLAVVTVSTIYPSLTLSAPIQKAPIVGGYSKASITDREVVMATRYAFKAQRRRRSDKIVLVVIESARKQVVTGTNYQLNFQVKTGGKTQPVTAIVHKYLKGKYSLLEWAIRSY